MILFITDVPRGTSNSFSFDSNNRIQNYSIYTDVPRGTFNNDIKATKPQTPSNTTNG